jgi:hypothetical protein
MITLIYVIIVYKSTSYNYENKLKICVLLPENMLYLILDDYIIYLKYT